MGNQALRKEMTKVQDKDFDPSKLHEWEDILWREYSSDVLNGFATHLSNETEVDDIFDYSCLIEEEDAETEWLNEDRMSKL